MTIPFKAVLHISPRPKKRPRFGKGLTFTDGETVNAEAEIRWLTRMLNPQKFEGPIYLKATFYLLRPKSLPKKRRHPQGRPDVDNYGKLLMDALNQLCYVDDSQIVDLHVQKAYGDPERIELEIGDVS